MKLLVAALVLGCFLLPQGMLSQERAYFQLSCRNCGSVVSIAADSLQRDLTGTNYNPVVQAKGNVVLRLKVANGSNGSPSFMLLSADSVAYREDTGDIVTAGNVHIKFETSEPSLAVR